MRKLGIAAKLYLAFGGIFLLAVIASSIGWKGFQQVTDSQNSVIDQAIPGLRQAHQLASLNAAIGAEMQQLLRARDEPEREASSQLLYSKVAQINDLIADFERQGFSPDSLQSLRVTVASIEERLRQQDALVEQRIREEARFSQLVAGLIDTTEELNDLADSLVANAAATTTAISSSLYDLVEDDASDQQLYNVFDRLVEVDLDAMERMYELRLRSANLNGLFNRVAKESDLAELTALRQRTAETLSILKRRVSEINDPLRRQKAGELLVAMEVDNGPLYVYGIFEARLSLIEINRQLTSLSLQTAEASQALNGIVSDLNAAGGELINRVSTTAKQSLDTSRQLFTAISVVLLLVAAAILWWFIKRNVVRRLSSLQSATQSITGGNYDVDIAVEGHDELTDMGRALEGFRDNAIRNRKLDEELRRHKTHLEELVEERSEQLRLANEKLSEEVENHAIARARAEQANEAKTAFLATMSHELRTPLSGALGTLRLLSDTGLKSGQQDYVNIINAANVSLLDIVNDILGYSQLEAGKLKLENRGFDLVELLNNVIGLMQVSVTEKGNTITLRSNLDDSLWLYGDSGKLHQVLINLIGNANKFTDSGQILLEVEHRGGERDDCAELCFRVEDTGIGIAPDKQQEVFQAFTQVDTSVARRYGGIGLGLAICERLVDALGGQISLDSELGQGTRIGFDIELPLGDATGASDPDALLETEQAPLRVLMVEDDATNAMVTGNYLEHLGHDLVTASTGEQALGLLDEADWQLVLLDISLPGIDGLAILKHIRTHANADIADVPVIAMSAHVFTEEVDQYLAAGMNAFLGKPFSLTELERAIAAAIHGGDPVIAKPGEHASLQTMDPEVVADDISRLGLTRVERLADVFRKSIMEQKQALLENRDNASARRDIAHKMKGSAGNFGLDRLCDLLGRIETCTDKPGEPIDPLLTQFETEYREALQALDNFLEQQAANDQDRDRLRARG